MQKIQTDPTLYYVDKQTKRQVFHAKVHNVYHHYLCFTYDSSSFPEPPVPLAGEDLLLVLRLRRLKEQQTLKTRMLMIKLRWSRNIKRLSEDNFQSCPLNEEKTNVGIKRIK